MVSEEIEKLRLEVKLAKIQSRRVLWDAFAEWWPLLTVLVVTIAPVCIAIIAMALGADLD